MIGERDNGGTLEELLADRIASEVGAAFVRAAERLAEVPKPEPEAWLTHEEMAKVLGISPDALYRGVASGEIPRDRIYGNVYRYSRRQVERAVASRRTPTSTTTTGADAQEPARSGAA